MTSVKPLYDGVRATVLDGLRREWQRYGWEDSEIDDKVDKLAKLWAAALHNTGAVTDTPQPQPPAEEEEKGEVGADGKRKRKRDEKPGEKRFKSGPRVDAPLTYPTFPPPAAAATAAASASAQPTALPSGYVPRFPSPMPSLSPSTSPQPSSVAAPSAHAAAAQPASTSHPDTSHNAANTPSERQLPVPSSFTTPSLTPASTSSSVKAEAPFLPLPLPLSMAFTASSSTDNPLLTEPLSSLDDDSDVDVELAAVKDLILCQYERVQHQKGRWKIAMRDGIVSVKGKEYAFSRLTGELQW